MKAEREHKCGKAQASPALVDTIEGQGRLVTHGQRKTPRLARLGIGVYRVGLYVRRILLDKVEDIVPLPRPTEGTDHETQHRV
jgi:hypothetical protein